MSFSTALSGLNAATADLNVKSNNIANVNTTGFKQSRAEFGDVFASSAFGTSSRTAIGSGVSLLNVAQQFTQGNLEFTDNSLDLGISGQGFFALAPDLDSGESLYTRAGEFAIDKNGFVVNNQGLFLRALPVNELGEVTATSINAAKPIQLPSTVGSPEATTDLRIATNLPSNAVPKAGIPVMMGDPLPLLEIDPTNPATFNHTTSATIFDSLGNEIIVSLYYQKIDPAVVLDGMMDPVGDNQWQLSAFVSTEAVGNVEDLAAEDLFPRGVGITPSLVRVLDAARISFNRDGSLDTEGTDLEDFVVRFAVDGEFMGDTIPALIGADSQTIQINLAGSTQNAGAFNVSRLSVNGFATGRLTGVDIGNDGLIRANYSNGQAVPIGKIAIANFSNVQALNNVGGTLWRETIDSGPVLVGEAGTGNFGVIQAGALETSNVDLTRELVGLITAQRNFQANSKSIETNNAITQTIINIR